MDEADALRLFALNEFRNIVDGVSDPDFLESLKTKEHNINWIKILNLLKKEILKELTDGWNDMWEEENLTEKLKTLKKLKNDHADKTEKAWRPVSGSIESQNITLDIELLKSMENHYTTLAVQEEEKVVKLKEELTLEWDKLRLHQDNIKMAKAQNEAFCSSIEEHLNENQAIISEIYFNCTNDDFFSKKV